MFENLSQFAQHFHIILAQLTFSHNSHIILTYPILTKFSHTSHTSQFSHHTILTTISQNYIAILQSQIITQISHNSHTILTTQLLTQFSQHHRIILKQISHLKFCHKKYHSILIQFSRNYHNSNSHEIITKFVQHSYISNAHNIRTILTQFSQHSHKSSHHSHIKKINKSLTQFS